MEKFVKIFEISKGGIEGSKLISKEELENLRSKIVVLNFEESEIAKKLGINANGVFGARFR